MYVAFDHIPPGSRIWVYQADRAFTGEEEIVIKEQGKDFLQQWAAHGEPLQASLCIMYKHFIIIAVDNEAHLPTGCSIDQSVTFIKSLEDQWDLSFFDRSKVALWQQNQVVIRPLAQVKKQIMDGELNDSARVFNNLIQTKSEMDQWIIPIKTSWLARYFTQTAGN